MEKNNKDDRFLFWWRWLIIATVLVLFFGLSMVLLSGPIQRLFQCIYLSSPYGAPIFPEDADAYIEFTSAVLGSVMFGWAVALLFIVNGPFRRRQKEAWTTITVSLLAWFFPDTAFSLYAGFWQNAILNVFFLGLFAVPLVATYGLVKASPNEGPHTDTLRN